MKTNNRKRIAPQINHRPRAAAAAEAAVRPLSAPKNRIARYFRDTPGESPFGATRRGRNANARASVSRRARPSDRASRTVLRRRRAERIADLPLEYMPSREFSGPNAERRIAGPMPAPVIAPRKVRVPSGLPAYLASLYETPLLTREQELHLFRKYNYLKYRAATLREKLNPKRPQLRIMDQIERLHQEAVATKNQIIQANLRLVVSIVKRYVTENDGTFELISEGNISLMRAVEKFDYTRGFRFSTYATWAIQKNNARHFADDVRRRIRFQTSQDEVLAGSPQEHFDPLHAERAQRERASQIAKILKRLDERDRRIIAGRFGLAGNEEAKTLKEVGAEMGVSKERVRQLERRAMQRLRDLARETRLKDPLE